MKTIAVVLLAAMSVGVNANEYSVSVTKEAKDLYIFSGKTQQMIAVAPGCPEAAVDTKAHLTVSSSFKSIMFPRDGVECNVSGVYGSVAETLAGKNQIPLVRVVRELYRIPGENAYFKTDGCFNSIIEGMVTIDINTNGKGTMSYNGSVCNIGGVYQEFVL